MTGSVLSISLSLSLPLSVSLHFSLFVPFFLHLFHPYCLSFFISPCHSFSLSLYSLLPLDLTSSFKIVLSFPLFAFTTPYPIKLIHNSPKADTLHFISLLTIVTNHNWFNSQLTDEEKISPLQDLWQNHLCVCLAIFD